MQMEKIAGQMLDNMDNLCITAGTLAMFCVGQSIFWLLVGSKQFENVVKDKIEIARLFLNNQSNQSFKVGLCQKLNSLVTTEDIERINTDQTENAQMMKNRFWTFFAVTFGVFVLTLVIVIIKYRKKINHLTEMGDIEVSKVRAQRNGFLLGLLLVFFSFATEIFIFKYIIEPFVIIGDLEIINKLL